MKKTIEDQGIKQVAALKALKPEENEELESIGERFPKNQKNLMLKSGKTIINVHIN